MYTHAKLKTSKKETNRAQLHGTWKHSIVMATVMAVVFSAAGKAADDAMEGRTPGRQAVKNHLTSEWPSYDQAKGGFELYKSKDASHRLTFGGSVLARYAYWNWFESSSHDNEYTCGFQRTRLHLNYSSKYWTAFVEPQYVSMFDLPDDAFKAPPEGPLGMGGLYCKHNNETDPQSVGIHQAYLLLRSPQKQFQLKLGRLEYSDGLEVLRKSDGQQFNTLKMMRLSDRMISSFGWSAFGRSFDGGVAVYDTDAVNGTAGFFYPTQGGFEKDSDRTIDDINIGTFTLTGKKDVLIPGMELAVFYYNYQDDRNVNQRVDNNPVPKPSDSVDIDMHTVGGRTLGVYEAGPGNIDVLFWGGLQFGDWYELDQQAYAFSVEAGYQFADVYAKPWLRCGYYTGSGDGDPGDGDHETFFQMAPGTRKYNLLPYCDLMNTEDIFAQLIIHPVKKLMVRMDYHLLRLNDKNDLWYMGSGPTQKSGGVFGYIGRPTSGHDDLAQEAHMLLHYNISPHWSAAGSYSHIWGGDVVSGVYSEDNDADYASLEIVFGF